LKITSEYFESPVKNEWLESSFLNRFISLVDIVYSQDVLYVPKNYFAFKAELLRPEWLPFQRSFLNEGCRFTARIQKEGGKSIGMISHFEAVDSIQYSNALFRDGISWLRSNGCKKIIGPIDGDTWHSYRLNLGPYEKSPFILEPYNPAYYEALWKDAGFRTIEEYSSKFVPDINRVKDSYSDSFQDFIKDGYTFRPLELKNFKKEIEILYTLTVSIFNQNKFYSEISLDEYVALYEKLSTIIKEDDIQFVLASNKKEVGFLFTLSQLNVLNLKTMGVLGEYRKKGMAKALIYQAYDIASNKGICSANMCLMHKDNPSQKLDASTGVTFRNYALFEYV
jgi:hypothetical protein